MTTAPLILTVRLDPASFAVLDALRQAHFPSDRNVVPAHLTLFHALPGGDIADIRDALAAAARVPPPPLVFRRPRFLGKGVAVDVESAELVALRNRLAAGWAGRLTPQDRQPYKPHVTVQNKVPPADARRLFDELSATWSPADGRGDGLLLWHYRGGPWELADEFPFADARRPA